MTDDTTAEKARRMLSGLPSFRSFSPELGWSLGLLLALTSLECKSAGSTASETRSEPLSVRAATNHTYNLTFDNTQLVVDARLGGRITQLVKNNLQLLTGPSVVAAGDRSAQNQFGSTFWVSPQSLWQWPPEVAVDSANYEVLTRFSELTLRGQVGASSGLAVSKRFAIEPKYLRIEYTMHNDSQTAVSAAPWEISRVSKGGIAFFPAQQPAQQQFTLVSKIEDDIAWVDLSQPFAEDAKLFKNGNEGWLAYAWQGVVFIKSFPDLPEQDQAPGEAEIEIYVNGTFDYVELEQQGTYAPIATNSSSEPWNVQWRVRQLPDNLQASVGNCELIEWVRAQLAN